MCRLVTPMHYHFHGNFYPFGILTVVICPHGNLYFMKMESSLDRCLACVCNVVIHVERNAICHILLFVTLLSLSLPRRQYIYSSTYRSYVSFGDISKHHILHVMCIDLLFYYSLFEVQCSFSKHRIG